MAKKPNYNFNKRQKEEAKAKRKQEKRERKRRQKDGATEEGVGAEESSPPLETLTVQSRGNDPVPLPDGAVHGGASKETLGPNRDQ